MGEIHHIPTRRSLTLHNTPFAAAPLPRIRRAPSFLLVENLSRAPANASFTNSLLPITAPSVKYLTRHLSIFAIPRSGRTVSFPSEASASAVFFVTASSFFLVSSIFPGLLPSARPIARRYTLEASFQYSASKPLPEWLMQALTNPSRAFFPLPFFPPPTASP